MVLLQHVLFDRGIGKKS